jgi:hypothetical protein
MAMEALFNIIMIFLLLVTIVFCWRLNNKIMALKESKKDLNQLVKTFDIAIIKTHKSIADLKVMSANSSAELQTYVAKATDMIEDLSYMNETAASLADRLESSIKIARQQDTQLRSPAITSRYLADEVLSDSKSNSFSQRSLEQKNRNINDNSNASTRRELMEAIKMIKG